MAKQSKKPAHQVEADALIATLASVPTITLPQEVTIELEPKSCKACKCFHKKGNVGECLRFPPSVKSSKELTPYGPICYYPVVTEATTACFEFISK